MDDHANADGCENLTSAMAEQEIRLYASHHQFYVQDSEPRGTTDDSSFWTQEATDNRLAIGDGLLGIGTGSYDFVRVRAEQHNSELLLDLSKWDHVTEADLVVKSKLVFIMGCLSRHGMFFEVKPGDYRVRTCHANLAGSEQEVPTSWTKEFNDWYLVQFWPSSCPLRRRFLNAGDSIAGTTVAPSGLTTSYLVPRSRG